MKQAELTPLSKLWGIKSKMPVYGEWYETKLVGLIKLGDHHRSS
jgi:hypothetical protein